MVPLSLPRLKGFEDLRVPGFEGGKWKVECGFDRFLPSTVCPLILDASTL
jgi:hypothetical protein